MLDIQPQQMILEKRERALKSFRFFVRCAWPEIEPGTPLVWNWHMDVICEHLQAVFCGQLTRLLINIAPGHAKSSLISVLFTVWTWLQEPTIRWLCASHAIDLAIRDNRNARRLIESPWFQSWYGDIFTLPVAQNIFFENNHKGYRMALGVRGSGTGKRGTHLLIDDPHNAMEGENDRKGVIEWFGKTWMSRLNDQERGPMIVVGQRLHQEDLSGHILQLGGWEHLNLPEEYEPARKSSTSIGWSDPRTYEGQLLWPERFNREVLDTLKRGLGSFDYAAQYQQTPAPSGGGQFRREWFRYCTETPEAYILEKPGHTTSILKASCRVFATVDLAISSKQTSDYTVVGFWAVTPTSDLILFDLIRGRFDNPEQQQQLELLNQRYRPDYIQIEAVAYQLALIQQLLVKGVPCREYKPVRDKVSRATTASIWFENGKVFFLKAAHWLPALESELLMFPKGAHDDQVDIISMAAEIVCSPRVPLSGDDDLLPPTASEHPFHYALPERLVQAPRTDPFVYAAQFVQGGDDLWAS